MTQIMNGVVLVFASFVIATLGAGILLLCVMFWGYLIAGVVRSLVNWWHYR